MSGTVRVSRDIFTDCAFRNEPLTEREAFMWLFMEARFAAGERRVGHITVQLERGQLAVSVRFLAEAWQWSKSRVQRFLQAIKKRDMIRAESGTGILVITICNYEKYQASAQTDGTATGQSVGHLRDTCGTKEKNGKEEDTEVTSVTSDAGASEAAPEDDFAKQLFDRGVAYLARHGHTERQARSVIGRWRKDHSDRDVFDAFAGCAKAGAVDPVPWITAALARAPPKGAPGTTLALFPSKDARRGQAADKLQRIIAAAAAGTTG